MNTTELIHLSGNPIPLEKPNGYVVFFLMFLFQFTVSFMFNLIRKIMYLIQTDIKKLFGTVICVTINYLFYSLVFNNTELDVALQESYFWITSITIFIIDFCVHPE